MNIFKNIICRSIFNILINPLDVIYENRYYIGFKAAMCKECYGKDLIQCTICNKRMHSKKWKTCFICFKISKLKKYITAKINSDNVRQFAIIRRKQLNESFSEKYDLEVLFHSDDTDDIIYVESELSHFFFTHRKRGKIKDRYWGGLDFASKDYLYLLLFYKKNQLKCF